MPTFGAPAFVDLFPEFAAGLRRLEKHSHLWVMAWLDSAERDLLTVVPRSAVNDGPEARHGVFAVRSPARPNPIGLTAARIVAIDGHSIELDLLDFIDQTPVVDLKPYFATRDIIFSATNEPVGRPKSRDALRESLLFQALRFHGAMSANLALGIRVMEHFRAEVLDLADPGDRLRIEVPAGRPDLVDALMGATRATPGRGTLKLTRRDTVIFLHQQYSFEYELIAAAENDPQAILAAPYDALFRFETFGP